MMMPTDPAWLKARNILAVRLDTLGDLLMTTPALRAIKETLPNSRITLLTSQRGAEAAGLIEEINDVIVYDSPWMKASDVRHDQRADRQMVDLLRKRKFDGAVIFTVFSQNPWASAFLCYLAGIPLRLAHSRENPYHLLSHWVKETDSSEAMRHEVRRQLDLVAQIGCYPSDERLQIKVPVAARSSIGRKLRQIGIDPDRPWAVLHPGASASSRRYSPAGYAAVARELACADEMQIVLTGTRGEVELVEEIRSLAEAGLYSLAGRLTLAELAALIEEAPVVITNNTGPAHLAAALGRPVVDLYALTNPQHTPWMTPSRVLSYDVPCRNCFKSVCPEGHHNCLRLVTPGRVVKAVRGLLADTDKQAVVEKAPAGKVVSVPPVT